MQATALPPRQPAGWKGIVNDPRFKAAATVNEHLNPYEKKYQPRWATTESQAKRNEQNQQVLNAVLERKRRAF